MSNRCPPGGACGASPGVPAQEASVAISSGGREEGSAAPLWLVALWERERRRAETLPGEGEPVVSAVAGEA